MEYKINIHSLVDVITNSSTVIYTWADEDSPNTLKEMIDEFLKITGSDKTCDDLFEIRLEADTDKIRDMMYEKEERDNYPEFKEYFEAEDHKDKVYDKLKNTDIENACEHVEYQEARDKADDIFYKSVAKIPYEKQMEMTDDDYSYPTSNIILKVKDTGEDKDIHRLFRTLFSQEATRDG